MLSKRLISCLDVRDGKLAKSIKFVDTKDIGDPIATARRYFEDGLDELGGQFDTIVVHQLIPEIVPVVVNYRFILFVDAHLGTIPDDVRVVQVQEEHHFHAVTHHMSPGMILNMARETKGVAPSGYLISVRGENFDFGLGLSERCMRHADIATEKILDLAQGFV